jgi:molybdopterin molybdotransferase
MSSILRNISVAEAIACFRQLDAVAARFAPLSEAIGLRLAEDVVIRRPQPFQPLAARNGYAVRAAALAGASERRPKSLAPDVQAIDSGMPLPAGTDAVLPFTHVAVRQRGLSATRAVAPSDGVTAPEAIAAPGEIFARAGTRLTFAVAMACAACDVTDVLVRRPVVDIVLNSPALPRPSQQAIGLICAAIRGSGCVIGSVVTAGGDAENLRQALLGSSGDIITVVGGVGDGPHDTTMAVIADAGQAVFHGVRMTPGANMGFGFVGGKPIFASPGNLPDMLAANIVLSWHFARRAFGRPSAEPNLVRAPLTDPIPAARAQARLIMVRLEDGKAIPLLVDRPGPREIALANGSIFMPEGSKHFRRGQIVPVLRMGNTM